ncbi:hypothetical protein KA107_00975 [Candidatus Pacearchaeota archaeon]|nr:hypothetical protein [Candidatus Pacearchaeota archaeon]
MEIRLISLDTVGLRNLRRGDIIVYELKPYEGSAPQKHYLAVDHITAERKRSQRGEEVLVEAIRGCGIGEASALAEKPLRGDSINCTGGFFFDYLLSCKVARIVKSVDGRAIN